MARKQNIPDEPQVWLTPKEVSMRWRNSIAEATLTNWRVRNHGPRFHKFGNRVLYRIEDVIEFETASLVNGRRPSA